MRIIKANENIEVKSVNILIYGEPGAGKSSLAATAENPLTLDFDKGVHRSAFRKDVLEIESWADIVNNMDVYFSTFEQYSTIIIDTVDTLLDFLGVWIIEQEQRLAYNKLQFYGRLKDEFTRFVNKLKTINKDIIFVAHVKERDEGDMKIKRPAITGGSYDRVLQLCDFVGYQFIKNNKRVLNFNPSDYWIGKNSAGLKLLEVPDFSFKPDYFAEIIHQMKSKINEMSKLQLKLINEIKDVSDKINKIENADELNLFIDTIEVTPVIKSQVWQIIKKHGEELNLKYTKKDGWHE